MPKKVRIGPFPKTKGPLLPLNPPIGGIINRVASVELQGYMGPLLRNLRNSPIAELNPANLRNLNGPVFVKKGISNLVGNSDPGGHTPQLRSGRARRSASFLPHKSTIG